MSHVSSKNVERVIIPFHQAIGHDVHCTSHCTTQSRRVRQGRRQSTHAHRRNDTGDVGMDRLVKTASMIPNATAEVRLFSQPTHPDCATPTTAHYRRRRSLRSPAACSCSQTTPKPGLGAQGKSPTVHDCWLLHSRALRCTTSLPWCVYVYMCCPSTVQTLLYNPPQDSTTGPQAPF